MACFASTKPRAGDLKSAEACGTAAEVTCVRRSPQGAEEWECDGEQMAQFPDRKGRDVTQSPDPRGQSMMSERKSRYDVLIDVINLVLGTVLFLAPWTFGFAPIGTIYRRATGFAPTIIRRALWAAYPTIG
jgi:hypothetical protein